ncbi:hypothetical protein SAMN02927924_01433 [Sphingobium faniae]|nr:hypothetical protein SAMN02927924_01433 [Sphingobium faniae]
MIFGALRPPLAHVAPMVAQCIAASVADDPLESLDEVMAGIEDGSLVAWVATEGERLHSVTVVEILEGGKGRQCFIRHCARADGGSHLRDWLGFLPVIEDWAASQGCMSIELIGRAGWERVLPDFQKKAVLLRKVLPHHPQNMNHWSAMTSAANR